MTWVVRIDRFLMPFDWLATVVLAVTVVAAGWLMLDRSPPFAILEVEPASARPGEIIKLHMRVMRDLKRDCSAEFTRYVFDSSAMRYYLDRGQASSDFIHNLEKRSPGQLHIAITVPEDVEPGPAELETVLDYRCNKMHRLWPIEVTTRAPFTVLPPLDESPQ